MPLTITLPDELAIKLQAQADVQQRRIDDVAVSILDSVLESEQHDSELEALVLRMQSRPSDPSSIHPATQELAELLANVEHEEPIDVEAWKKDWAKAEAELKAITHANDVAEGRA